MGKVKLLFEVEEGKTPSCEKCKLSEYDGYMEEYYCCGLAKDRGMNCKKYDFSTIKFKKKLAE